MRFVVIGGGCYGTFYARQLLRAADVGAIEKPEILVVDHDAAPQISRELADARIQLDRREWETFFDDYFRTLSPDSHDQIVPPPFTPHLAVHWLLRALNRDGSRQWSIEPFKALPQTPFVRQSEIGTLNASHADWLCPIHCIEPDVCPHTKGDRHWDMADTVRAFARTLGPAGQKVSQVHLFQCLHLTHGVGTYPAAAVVQARQQLRKLKTGENETIYAVVGTVSRCHGTMHLLKGTLGMDTVSPRASDAAIPSTHANPNS